MWQPSAYALNRPYFIPVYGPAGQIPIFFPPQALNRNIGVPADNPFTGPQYLPPNQSTMKPSTGSTPKIGDRYGTDDDEPRPAWPNENVVRTERPRPSNSGIVPTRLPKRKQTTPIPSLIHKGTNAEGPINAPGLSVKETESTLENVFDKPDSSKTTPVPAASITKEVFSGPSLCAWAVVSCCTAGSANVVDSCFEQQGCPGPFWGNSPCDSDFAKSAINEALEYYGK